MSPWPACACCTPLITMVAENCLKVSKGFCVCAKTGRQKINTNIPYLNFLWIGIVAVSSNAHLFRPKNVDECTPNLAQRDNQKWATHVIAPFRHPYGGVFRGRSFILCSSGPDARRKYLRRRDPT